MVFTADTDLTHNNVRFNMLELLIKDINYKIISGRPFLDWMKGFQHPAELLPGIIQTLYLMLPWLELALLKYPEIHGTVRWDSFVRMHLHPFSVVLDFVSASHQQFGKCDPVTTSADMRVRQPEERMGNM